MSNILLASFEKHQIAFVLVLLSLLVAMMDIKNSNILGDDGGDGMDEIMCCHIINAQQHCWAYLSSLLSPVRRMPVFSSTSCQSNPLILDKQTVHRCEHLLV